MTDFLFCQINKVNCELDRVRSMINDRLETEKTKVEKFLVELREERHRVESVRDEHCFFMQNNNIVEIINKRDERMDQLKRAAAPHPSELKMEEKTLLTGKRVQHCNVTHITCSTLMGNVRCKVVFSMLLIYLSSKIPQFTSRPQRGDFIDSNVNVFRPVYDLLSI